MVQQIKYTTIERDRKQFFATEFCREDAAREARRIYSIQQDDWALFPERMKLSLMLDAVILLIARIKE